MTALLVWCVAGFLWVFFFPATSVPSQWAQVLLAGPLIWLTMLGVYVAAFLRTLTKSKGERHEPR